MAPLFRNSGTTGGVWLASRYAGLTSCTLLSRRLCETQNRSGRLREHLLAPAGNQTSSHPAYFDHSNNTFNEGYES